MIRKYPSRKGKELSGVEQSEFEAVRVAVENTQKMRDGQARLKVIDMVFWKKSKSLSGAALWIPCSEWTAQKWHAHFIREVARNFHCDRLL